MTWLALRWVKWIAVAWFTAGLGLATLGTSTRSRLAGALTVATTGLMACWLTGYGMMKLQGGSMGDPSISWTLLASLGALLGAVLAAILPWRAPGVGLTVGGLAASLGWMTVSGQLDHGWLLGGLAPVLLGVLAGGAALALPAPEIDSDERADALTRWFVWIARGEGVSLLVLFGIYMPLKYGAHIEIDGGQGWIGWIHGILVMLYVLALSVTSVVGRWGLIRPAVGFFASLVPFGTFVFERFGLPDSADSESATA